MRNLFWRLWGDPVRNTEARVRKEREANSNLIVTNFVHVINASVSIIIYSVGVCARCVVLSYMYIGMGFITSESAEPRGMMLNNPWDQNSLS